MIVKPERMGEPGVDGGLSGYTLLDALQDRRSRRFGMGIKIPDGPFAYESRHEPLPLTEAEEAALAFAACGVTGYALADLSYGRGQGGGMRAGLLRENCRNSGPSEAAVEATGTTPARGPLARRGDETT